MKRLAVLAAVLGVVASLAGCATPCCYCYCGEIPTQNLLDVAAPARAEVPAPSMNNAVVARY